MAVTTRNRTTTVPSTPAKKASAASKRGAKKAAPVEPQSEEEEDSDMEDAEEEEDEEEEDEEDEEDDDEEEDEDIEGEDSAEEEEEEDQAAEESDEDSFKIHAPKANLLPKIVPAVLPTYNDEEDSDSDAAPEAESLSSAKAKVLTAQDKEKLFLSKVQAEQKAKRVEKEQKLKAQKDQSKKKTKPPVAITEEPSGSSLGSEGSKKNNLPTMLPLDILESVAKMDSSTVSHGKGDKKRKISLEDSAMLDVVNQLREENQKRRKAEKTQKNVGPVTVKVLDQSKMAKGHAVPETIIDFRKQHFFGSKIPRKDAVLNGSQGKHGAAMKFNRKK
ncbi:U3 small nucleolar RNA-associated protein 16 [Entomortierella parvispora]|uniref:U3 small nucleolar RNA-associated protein 16 n=1 Tax=Entomortierella parvispora TaxID=205924 RepID=A0A9P3HFN9_9FUNG|nr:U3 small nucleolar RNA-associated protein 16 [Entomortierella parvispora]